MTESTSTADTPAVNDGQQPSSSSDQPHSARATIARDGTSGRSRLLWHPRSLVILLVVTLGASIAWQWWINPARIARRGMEALRQEDEAMLEQTAQQLQSDPAYEYYADFFRAVVDLRHERPKEALQLLGDAMTHPDLAVEARVLAGQAAYEVGAAGNAKVYWEEALARDPYCVPAHRWLGAMYFDLGAMDNALLHLQAVSNLDVEDPRPDRLMGLINRDYERPQIAIPHYQETLRRAPDQPGVEKIWLELADCQVKQREFEAARESLSHCAETSERNRLLAQCLINLGELDEAKRLAQRALEAAEQDVETLQLNAQIRLLEGDVQAASELLKRAVAADPFDHGARSQLSQVLGRQGDAEQSEFHSRRAEELQTLWQEFSDLQIDAINDNTNAEIRLRIGQLAQQLGKPELAASWFRAALAINPGLTEASQSLRQLDSPQ